MPQETSCKIKAVLSSNISEPGVVTIVLGELREASMPLARASCWAAQKRGIVGSRGSFDTPI